MWGPAWIEIHWNNIWLRNRSHTTSHYTWGSVTTLHDFGYVLVRPLDTFFWAPTFSWSWLLARVCGPELQSGCQLCKVLQFVIEEIPLQHQLRKYGHSHCVSTANSHVPMWDQREDDLIYGHCHMLIVLHTSKECGCYLVQFFHVLQLLPITFTPQNIVLHQRIDNETCAKIGLDIGPPLIFNTVIGNACLLISWLVT